MSIIIRDLSIKPNLIKIYTKGADSFIK